MSFLAAATLAAGVYGAYKQSKGTDRTNAMQAQEAQRDRDFQERMSNTSYQRGRKDLEAAGYNPILAFTQGGATTASGGQAAYKNPKEGYAAAAMNLAAGTASIEKTRAETEGINAQNIVKKLVASEVTNATEAINSMKKIRATTGVKDWAGKQLAKTPFYPKAKVSRKLIASVRNHGKKWKHVNTKGLTKTFS